MRTDALYVLEFRVGCIDIGTVAYLRLTFSDASAAFLPGTCRGCKGGIWTNSQLTNNLESTVQTCT